MTIFWKVIKRLKRKTGIFLKLTVWRFCSKCSGRDINIFCLCDNCKSYIARKYLKKETVITLIQAHTADGFRLEGKKQAADELLGLISDKCSKSNKEGRVSYTPGLVIAEYLHELNKELETWELM